MSETTTTQNNFIAQLQADTEKYQDSSAQEEYCAQVREQAVEHFLEELLSGPTASKQFETLAIHRNKLGQKTARLAQWQGRGPTYLDQCLSDLLDIGDLLQRMQDHLDSTYGPGEFRVFNHRVRGNRNRTVSLTVSWNKEGFENVDSIIENNRQRAQERQQRQQEGHGRGDGEDEDDDDEEDDLAPRSSARQGSYPPRRQAPGRAYDDRRQPPRRRYESGADRAPAYDSRPPRRQGDGYGEDRPRPQRRPERYDDRPPRRPMERTSEPRPEPRAERSERPAERSTAPRPSRRREAVASYDN